MTDSQVVVFLLNSQLLLDKCAHHRYIIILFWGDNNSNCSAALNYSKNILF